MCMEEILRKKWYTMFGCLFPSDIHMYTVKISRATSYLKPKNKIVGKFAHPIFQPHLNS